MLNGYSGLSTGLSGPGRKADHSPHLYAVYLKLLPLKKYGFKPSFQRGYPGQDAWYRILKTDQSVHHFYK
jgi:hypothetical protein